MSGDLVGLDHVIVGVGDLEAATTSYASLLGRAPSWRGTHPEQGTENTLFRLDNTYLELLAPLPGETAGAGEALRRRLAEKGEGVVGLAFATADAAAFAARMRAVGVDVGAPVEGRGRSRDGASERTWRSVWLPPSATRGNLLFAIEHLGGDLPAAAPQADEAGAAAIVARLDHVVVMTARAEEARRVYGDVLGLRLALDREFEKRGLRLLFFRAGRGAAAVTVEIAASLGEASLREASLGDPGADPGADNLWGLAYEVADVDAARRRLLAAGFEVTEARHGQKPGTRVCTVRSGTHGVATLMIEPAAREEASDG